MSNSSLVDYTLITSNKTPMQNKKIKKITIHHMAGNLSVEVCGNVFQTNSASANYGVGSDGRVGLYVDECDRAWTSSNSTNDSQAVTIEVANDEIGGNWHVSDTALNKTIELCVDICRRNGIKKINFTGDSSGNLTMHKYFAATLCPGPYLESKFPYIAQQINKALGTGGELTREEYVEIHRHPVVKIGSRGEEVRYLQEWLNRFNYNCGSEDGHFGSGTQSAVKKFQKDYALTPDGSVGPATWSALEGSIYDYNHGDRGPEPETESPKPEPSRPEQSNTYTIKPGDTMYSIARKFNISYKELAEYNNISNPSLISVGQTLQIPGAQRPTVNCSITLPVLEFGANNNSVKNMQLLLKDKKYNCPINGSFDSITKNIVTSFQRDSKLKITNKCDKETWELLLK